MPATARNICLSAFFMIAASAPAGSHGFLVHPVVEVSAAPARVSISKNDIEESVRREAYARLIQHNNMN